VKNPDYLKVPIPMCIWVAQNNLEKPFQTFLHLKMQYRNGKTQLNRLELLGLSQVMGGISTKTIKQHIQKLSEIHWMKRNTKTGFYHINSFERIRAHYGWESRASLLCEFKDIQNVYGFIGGAIYTYQFYDFWRKVRKERIVRIMGRAYNFLSSSFNFREHHAPVATTGIEALYGIPQKKASRLKIAAIKSNTIKVKKDFQKLDLSFSEIKLMMKFGYLPPRVKQLKGEFYLQSIDLILPLKHIKKRPKLTT
jgi:hypothetical protein